MSRFIERLQKTGTQSPTPLGFGAATRRSETVTGMLLVGRAAETDMKVAAGLSNLDAILVALDSWEKGTLDALGESLKDKLWGVAATGIDRERAEMLKARGCDFIVFEAEQTSAAILNDEELGKIISVDSDLDEETARAIQELPIDGVLVTSPGDLLPLTVKRLIGFQSVRGLVDKPFVMDAPPGLGPSDLEVLRNAGVSGLVVEASSESVTSTREAIAALPRAKQWVRSDDMASPSVPSLFGLAPQDEEEEPDGF